MAVSRRQTRERGFRQREPRKSAPMLFQIQTPQANQHYSASDPAAVRNKLGANLTHRQTGLTVSVKQLISLRLRRSAHLWKGISILRQTHAIICSTAQVNGRWPCHVKALAAASN